jgi:hypothetical protein
MIRKESKEIEVTVKEFGQYYIFGVSVSNQLSILSDQTSLNNTELTVLVLYGYETWYHKEYFGTGCWGDDVYHRQRNLRGSWRN